MDYMTPLFPQYFLPLAAVANVGKSVGLTTYISTQVRFSSLLYSLNILYYIIITAENERGAL